LTTDADVAFGMMRMEPHTAQSFIKASRRFLTMGAGADQFLRRRMSEEIAIEINRWCLKGSGANNEPLGLLNTSGVNVANWSGAAPDTFAGYQKLREMELQVANSDALMGSLGWAAAPALITELHQMRSETAASAGDPVGETARHLFSDAMETALLGYQFRTTTQLDAGSGGTGELIFGDWSRLVMARWGTVVIEASNTANDALQKRQTHIVAYMDVDVGVTQPTAFSVATDIQTS
jgi:HK97 family phage major capsid protein